MALRCQPPHTTLLLVHHTCVPRYRGLSALPLLLLRSLQELLLQLLALMCSPPHTVLLPHTTVLDKHFKQQHEHAIWTSSTAGVATAAGPEVSATSHHSVGETLYVAKEATVSGASVAVLILWTIAVTGWTGFQVRLAQAQTLDPDTLSRNLCCKLLSVLDEVDQVLPIKP